MKLLSSLEHNPVSRAYLALPVFHTVLYVLTSQALHEVSLLLSVVRLGVDIQKDCPRRSDLR